MKLSLLAATAATLLTLLACATPEAHAGPSGSHPYFADSGTLAWSTDLAEAQAAARSTGKLVFIEYGRRACSNCRTLVSKYLPCPMLKTRFSDACVGLAADCDESDPRVDAIFKRGLPGACALPFVAFVSADLVWVTGWAGATTPSDIAEHLRVAETRRAKDAVARGATQKAAPAPMPSAAPACTTAPAAAVPVRPPTGRSTPAVDVEKARALLVRARAAAAAGRHGEVLRLDVEAGRLSVRIEPAEWAALGLLATTWAERCLSSAEVAAKDRRCDEAAKLLGDLKREMEGRPAETEAARGERAVAKLRFVNAASAAGREVARAAAAKEFKGTRWEALFQG